MLGELLSRLFLHDTMSQIPPPYRYNLDIPKSCDIREEKVLFYRKLNSQRMKFHIAIKGINIIPTTQTTSPYIAATAPKNMQMIFSRSITHLFGTEAWAWTLTEGLGREGFRVHMRTRQSV